MDHALVYFGGGEVMYYIAQAMATILGDEGFCKSLFRIIGFLGITWCSVRFMYTRNSKETVAWFGSFILLTTFAYTAKMNIRIIDKVSGFERRVDNVPWVWGKPAYLLNHMGFILAQKMDQVFTAIPVSTSGGGHYMPYYETGTVFASKLMSKARHFKIMDPTFNGNLERFINQCVVFGALIGNRYTMKDLLNTDDIWDLVKRNASPVMGFSYRTPDGDAHSIGEEPIMDDFRGRTRIITCRDGAQKLEDEWVKQLDEASARYGKAFFPNIRGDAKAAFLQRLPESYHLLTSFSKEAPKLLQQSMMINAIDESPNRKLSELGSAMNYGTTKTLLQQRTNFAIAGEVARDTLPIIKVVLEALTYASFIFVFFIALLPNGFRVFKTYFEMLLSLQLWPLLYTILNFIMTIYGRWQTGGVMGEGGLSLVNASAIAEINADIAAYAGYWSMLVPIFAYMITKGGVSSMVQAAGQIGNAFMSASSAAAQEVSSGNVSLGNMQYGTQSILNTSGFKHDTSFSSIDNQIGTVMEDGTFRQVQPGGEVIFRGGGGMSGSQLGIKASSMDHMEKSAVNALNHSEGMMQSKSEEWSNSQSAMVSNVVDHASTFSESLSSGKAYDMSEGHAITQSLQNVETFRNELSNRYGLSSTQSNQVMAGISAGKTLVSLITPSMGFNFQNQAERQAVYDEVKGLSETYSVTDSIERSAQGMQKIHFGENSSEEQRLAESISASYQTASSHKSDLSRAQQYHDNMSNLVQTMQSGAFNIERDQTQDLLNYVANQTDHGYRIGSDAARRILEMGGPMALSMIASYQQDQWNRIDSTIRGSDKVLSPEELGALYQDQNHFGTHFRDEFKGRSPETTFREDASRIREGNPMQGVSDQARSDFEKKHTQVEQEMREREAHIAMERHKTEVINQTHQDMTITEVTGRNLLGGIDKDV